MTLQIHTWENHRKTFGVPCCRSPVLAVGYGAVIKLSLMRGLTQLKMQAEIIRNQASNLIGCGCSRSITGTRETILVESVHIYHQ